MGIRDFYTLGTLYIEDQLDDMYFSSGGGAPAVIANYVDESANTYVDESGNQYVDNT